MPKVLLTKKTAKSMARVLQDVRQLARGPSSYTLCLAMVADHAGYQNIHEMIASYVDDDKKTNPKLVKDLFVELLEAENARPKTSRGTQKMRQFFDPLQPTAVELARFYRKANMTASPHFPSVIWEGEISKGLTRSDYWTWCAEQYAEYRYFPVAKTLGSPEHILWLVEVSYMNLEDGHELEWHSALKEDLNRCFVRQAFYVAGKDKILDEMIEVIETSTPEDPIDLLRPLLEMYGRHVDATIAVLRGAKPNPSARSAAT